MRTSLLILTLIILMGGTIGGCDTTSEQRITALKTAVDTTQVLLTQATDKVASLEKSLLANEAMAKNPSITPEQLQQLKDELASIKSAMAVVKPAKDFFEAQMAGYQKDLADALATGSIDKAKEIKLYAKGIGSGATSVSAVLPPPWNLIVALLGAGATALAGSKLTARKDAIVVKEKEVEHETVVGGIVGGTSELLGNLPTPEAVAKVTPEIVTKLAEAGISLLDVETAKNMLARLQAKQPEVAAAVQKALAVQKTAEQVKTA